MTHKAPGKHYRNGISLIDLFDMFPDESSAEKWLEEERWGIDCQDIHCPKCNGTEKIRKVPSRNPMPYWCGACRRNFSVRIGYSYE